MAFPHVSHFSSFVLALRSYHTSFKSTFLAGYGWYIPVLPELWRLKQVDHYDFKASLGYTASAFWGHHWVLQLSPSPSSKQWSLYLTGWLPKFLQGPQDQTLASCQKLFSQVLDHSTKKDRAALNSRQNNKEKEDRNTQFLIRSNQVVSQLYPHCVTFIMSWFLP